MKKKKKPSPQNITIHIKNVMESPSRIAKFKCEFTLAQKNETLNKAVVNSFIHFFCHSYFPSCMHKHIFSITCPEEKKLQNISSLRKSQVRC